MSGPRFGLPRARRLPAAPAFAAALRRGVRSRDNLFSVYAVANATQQSRLGVTVSRKSAPLAVTRNRIKRHVRESFRHLAPERLAGLDVVVVAQPAAAKSAPEALRHSLALHWQRIHALCATSP